MEIKSDKMTEQSIQRREEIHSFKKAELRSCVREYKNGYKAYFIDLHPHGAFYRDPHNPSGIVALPEEGYMLQQSCGVVVMFLKNTEDLDRIEKEMKLERV